MKKELKEYLEIVDSESVKYLSGLVDNLKEYAGTHEDLTADEIEEQIYSYLFDDLEDADLAFDNSQKPEAIALLEVILSDLEDHQERIDREYEEEREAMNRAYRHAKGFN